MQNLEKILSDHSFFKNLPDEYLNLIVGCASNVRFDKDEQIFTEGEEAKQFYLIREGKVALEIHGTADKNITIDTLEGGDILGWSWLVSPYYWRFDSRAMRSTRAIALDGKCLRDKCEEDHSLGYNLLKRFTQIIDQRLQATRLQLMDVYGE